ncbi:hypothetical protein BV898_19787 [Hypsibius exemplaris]|uniref:Uncharacterized protein n=1 Tax=Hypsibius exemplaris TaxID=2072580 RepID=A0A9X6RQ31_HYPEX|nr:hypothetical protein BV898_19787 [Hypsibius exemplaris]
MRSFFNPRRQTGVEPESRCQQRHWHGSFSRVRAEDATQIDHSTHASLHTYELLGCDSESTDDDRFRYPAERKSDTNAETIETV